MNDKEKAVLDAARECAGAVRDPVISWTPALERLRLTALDAFPANPEPQPETVRDVADLRDGETVLLWGEEWVYKAHVDGRRLFLRWDTGILSHHLLDLAVAAGAVTRPPRPEPDPADVERLAGLLDRSDVANGFGKDSPVSLDTARWLLRSGEITLRNPS